MFKGALQVLRLHEPVHFSKAAHRRSWEAFLKHGTNHSSNASTLCEIINRCEREGIPYILQANPGHGYFIKRGPEIDTSFRDKG